MLSDKEQQALKKSYQREYYPKHKDAIKARMAVWRKNNPAALARHSDKDNRRATRKKYRATHKEYCVKSQAVWRNNNPEYMKEYYHQKKALGEE